MFFLPLSILFFLFLILLLPILFFLIQMGIVGTAFHKLGLSPSTGILIFFVSILCSTINIPIVQREALPAVYDEWNFIRHFFGFSSTITSKQVIAINVGGAIIPLLLVLYLLPRVPLPNTLIAVVISIIVCKFLARPVPRVGIVLPAFIPPILAALLAMILVRRNPAPAAYITGVLGTLIGADLLNLHRISGIGAGMVSIGGAGVYDGIYLVGIIAVLLA